MSFSTILFTEKGRALQSKALAGTALNFTKLVMGSGSLGSQSQIALTSLIEPKVTLNITEIKRSDNYATVKGIFSNSDIGTGFYWREIGVYAQDPDIGEILYCYGNSGALAEYIPPQSSEIIEKVISLSIIVGDAANVTATINESLVYASVADLDNLKNDLSVYQKAAGTATEIILTGLMLEDGWSKTFIVNSTNNGAPTTINGKSLYKPGTVNAPKLIPGKAVTVWYDAPGDCFFIKASATGNAIAAHVLAPDTFSNEGDTDIVGTMIDRGAVNQALPINGTYTIPEGYHNGLGQVTQAITSKAAATITPGTADQVIAAGQYLSGEQIIKGDANLIPSKIPLDTIMFGIQGTRSLGKKFASGTAYSSSTEKYYQYVASTATMYGYPVAVTGLSFKPSVIIIERYINNELYITLYDEFNKIYPKTVYLIRVGLASNSNVDYTFKGDVAPAYVINGSFEIPFFYPGIDCTYLAIE